MKKLFTILLLFPLASIAQDAVKDSLWTTSTATTLNFSQVSLTNWAAGGESSMSALFMVNYTANYKKDKLSWDNTFDLRYGFLKQDGDDLRKSDDLIDISSKLGIEAGGNWNYSGLLNFKSQFATGYEYADDDSRTEISKFMAPGYLTGALGMDYKTEKLTVLMAPVSAKLTFVTDDDLSDAGAYGVDAGDKMRAEFGGSVKVGYKNEVVKNVTFDSTLGLFTNYLDKPQNVDIDWKVQINMKVNEFLSANLITQMIYDDDVKITDSDTGISGSRLQFMESFGVGLTFKF